jgi:hypothetical protein
MVRREVCCWHVKRSKRRKFGPSKIGPSFVLSLRNVLVPTLTIHRNTQFYLYLGRLDKIIITCLRIGPVCDAANAQPCVTSKDARREPIECVQMRHATLHDNNQERKVRLTHIRILPSFWSPSLSLFLQEALCKHPKLRSILDN